MARLLVLAVLATLIGDHVLQAASVDKDGYHPTAQSGGATPRGKTRQNDIDWNARAANELEIALNVWPKWTPAKNVILFIGDGMGVSSLTAGRFFRAQKITEEREEDANLAWESFPHTGVIKTYNTDQATPDSAGTATAMLCGVKARAGVIGVNQNVALGDCAATANNTVRSFLHLAQDEGKWAGIVTTTRITHATPASAFAHSPHRDWENNSDLPADNVAGCVDIAAQLIRDEDNKKLRVILGGGRREFLPEDVSDPEYSTYMGQRTDGVNLTEEWQSIKAQEGLSSSQYKYVERKSEFDGVDASAIEYLFGLFEPAHMQYEADRAEDAWGEPSLAEMVEKALGILQRSDSGYALLVEGGRIDHAHHDGNAHRSMMDVVALQDAVAKAVEMTSEDDTQIVVTADHSHVFTFGGYPKLDNDILGVVTNVDGEVSLADDDKPYLTLAYANGPGFEAHRGNIDVDAGELGEPRKNVTGDDTADKDYLQDAAVPLYSETHGGEDVLVYARGPMSHLFGGQHEQNYIAHAIMYATCVGPNKEMCENPRVPPSGTGSTLSGSSTLVLVTIAAFVSRLCINI